MHFILYTEPKFLTTSLAFIELLRRIATIRHSSVGGVKLTRVPLWLTGTPLRTNHRPWGRTFLYLWAEASSPLSHSVTGFASWYMGTHNYLTCLCRDRPASCLLIIIKMYDFREDLAWLLPLPRLVGSVKRCARTANSGLPHINFAKAIVSVQEKKTWRSWFQQAQPLVNSVRIYVEETT